MENSVLHARGTVHRHVKTEFVRKVLVIAQEVVLRMHFLKMAHVKNAQIGVRAALMKQIVLFVKNHLTGVKLANTTVQVVITTAVVPMAAIWDVMPAIIIIHTMIMSKDTNAYIVQPNARHVQAIYLVLVVLLAFTESHVKRIAVATVQLTLREM